VTTSRRRLWTPPKSGGGVPRGGDPREIHGAHTARGGRKQVNASPDAVVVVVEPRDAEEVRAALRRDVVAPWRLWTALPALEEVREAPALVVAARETPEGRALAEGCGRLLAAIPKDRRPVRQWIRIPPAEPGRGWTELAEWVEEVGYLIAERRGLQGGG
jgi:hypothetical protein